MKLSIGDRVYCGMDDRYGHTLNGTVIDNNYLGFAVLVKCDTQVDKQYCYTDDLEVMFTRSMLEIIKNE